MNYASEIRHHMGRRESSNMSLKILLISVQNTSRSVSNKVMVQLENRQAVTFRHLNETNEGLCTYYGQIARDGADKDGAGEEGQEGEEEDTTSEPERGEGIRVVKPIVEEDDTNILADHDLLAGGDQS